MPVLACLLLFWSDLTTMGGDGLESGWRPLPVITDGRIADGWVHVGWGGFNMKTVLKILLVIIGSLVTPLASGAEIRIDPSAPARVTKNQPVGEIQRTTPPANPVRLQDRSLCDEGGPFLGLGASYFQALRDAKYDRPRLNHNLALLASKGSLMVE
jgi:hypothetical protein